MKSLNENGVSTCQAGQENYVYFNLMSRLRKKAGIVNTTTAILMASYSPPMPRHWIFVGSAGMNS